MKKIIVSVLFAAMMAAPVFAGGDCCSKQTAKAAEPAAAACASCAKEGKTEANGQAKMDMDSKEKSCCAGEKAEVATKACQTCDSHAWMMAKPNPNCKACQTASL